MSKPVTVSLEAEKIETGADTNRTRNPYFWYPYSLLLGCVIKPSAHLGRDSFGGNTFLQVTVGVGGILSQLKSDYRSERVKIR